MVILLNKQQTLELLQNEIDKFHEVKIERTKIDDKPIYCIPLILSPDLVLVQFLYDFAIDGYKILRIKDITSIRSGDLERFSENIFRNEDILEQVSQPSIELSSWSIVFTGLTLLEKNIIVECEALGDFHIGRIVKVTKTCLSLLKFDPFGVWDNEATKIPFKDISVVCFDDRYSRVMSKYTL